MKRVEIIAIGKEILRGQTLDTNSSWLAKRVTALGGTIGRIVIPDDDVAAIAGEIQNSFQSKAQVIITTGGLGPTFDDKTLAGIAEATSLPLVLNARALEIVTRRYQELWSQGFVEAPNVTPPRQKMALLPQGAEPLDNPVGTAPAVALKIPLGVIFSLPGVPEEMRAIFEQTVASRLKEILGVKIYLEEAVNTGVGDESILAEFIEKIMKRVPGTYLKSKATAFGKAMSLDVIITAAGSDQEAIAARIKEAKKMLLEFVKNRPTRTAE